MFPAYSQGGRFSLHRAGERQRGAILFPRKENSPPYTPQEKGTRGLPPRPRTLAVSILKSCSACGIGCGVHGFAMNPCISLLLSTAPYYREARVTVVGRQTAYRMRHCCARRIDKTGGRRKLLRTSTRWAERQRMIGAEANRIAVPTRLCRAQASPFRRHRSHSSPRLPINPFLLGVQGGYSLSEEREYPPFSHPARYGIPLYPLGQNAKIKPTLRQVLFLGLTVPVRRRGEV